MPVVLGYTDHRGHVEALWRHVSFDERATAVMSYASTGRLGVQPAGVAEAAGAWGTVGRHSDALGKPVQQQGLQLEVSRNGVVQEHVCSGVGCAHNLAKLRSPRGSNGIGGICVRSVRGACIVVEYEVGDPPAARTPSFETAYSMSPHGPNCVVIFGAANIEREFFEDGALDGRAVRRRECAGVDLQRHIAVSVKKSDLLVGGRAMNQRRSSWRPRCQAEEAEASWWAAQLPAKGASGAATSRITTFASWRNAQVVTSSACQGDMPSFAISCR